jgi:4-amino-4-deoxy-L-arabinose transferase-like glycosyltransferase
MPAKRRSNAACPGFASSLDYAVPIPVNDSETGSAPLLVGSSAPAPIRSEPSAQARRGRPELLRWAPHASAFLIAVFSLLLPLRWSGLWAPYELETAEFSRRIAVTLHGAEQLALPGANNAVPSLSELGRGQLPFSAVALGFQCFGLRDWAGRLPLALWGLIGIAATFVLVARLYDRVAAAYASVALASMPLYFLQSRTLLGDIVPLGSVAVATCGLALAIFQPELTSRRARAGWVGLALVGLVTGFASRGVLLGVACPALGVGLGWLIWRCTGRRQRDRFASTLGWLALGLGLLALGAGAWALRSGSPDAYLELLGAALNPPGKLPTHDQVLHQLGFGLFPWSAIAPFALAVALGTDNEAGPESALSVCLVSVFAVAFALHGLCAPTIAALPFVATFTLAALIGVAFRRIESGAQGTRLVALGAAALLIVFAWDLRSYPEESLLPFVLADATFPESFSASAKHWVDYGALPCLVVLALALGDLPRATQPRPFAAFGEYTRWLSALAARGRGRVLAALAGITLLLGVLPVLRFLASRGMQINLLDRLGTLSRPLGYAFLIVPAFLVTPLVSGLLRDLSQLLLQGLDRLPIPRARLGVLSLAGFGLALSLGYYPALAAQLSPRDVFEAFRHRHQPGEALAVLGPASRVAPYYAGAAVETPSSPSAGFDWLVEAKGQRRWLVLGSKELPQLNSLFRQHSEPRANLPILDAASSEVLLAVNELAPGEHNDNPLDAWISSERPTPERPLDVDLSGQLRCIGWALTDPEGRQVAQVRTGRRYDFRIYWEVLDTLSSNWRTFIHIDGKGRRFNGDHDTLEGKYPFKYWQKGDFLTDVYHFELEPHFAGATYQVYFGLFVGDRRLSVRTGKHTEDRIIAGSLVVD